MASRRGCRRSSLELMKLLYQLDARDPMGVLLGTWRWCRHETGQCYSPVFFVSPFFFLFSLPGYDRYCLRALEEDHLMAIFEAEDNDHIRRLPNWLYSYALATVLSCTTKQRQPGVGNKSGGGNVSGAKVDEEEKEEEEEKERTHQQTMARASRLLVRAILSYPEIAIGKPLSCIARCRALLVEITGSLMTLYFSLAPLRFAESRKRSF